MWITYIGHFSEKVWGISFFCRPNDDSRYLQRAALNTSPDKYCQSYSSLCSGTAVALSIRAWKKLGADALFSGPSGCGRCLTVFSECSCRLILLLGRAPSSSVFRTNWFSLAICNLFIFSGWGSSYLIFGQILLLPFPSPPQLLVLH